MTTHLRIFCFPQHWDGARLELRVLTAPFGNPVQPLQPGLPSFADAQLVLSAKLIGGSMSLPIAAAFDEAQRLQIQAPADMSAAYQAFATHFGVDPTAPQPYVAPVNTRFLKMLMPSYRDASGYRQPRTELAVTDNRYVCALADGARPGKRPAKPVVPPKWDVVLAMALRQPVLAQRLGLIHRAFLTPDDQARWSEGGWLYVDLDDASDYFAAAAQPDFLKCYAARLPPLLSGKPRAVFAPVLFPVTAVPPAGSFDELLHEADTYSDGFARLVHSYQPDRVDYLNLVEEDGAAALDRRSRIAARMGRRANRHLAQSAGCRRPS